MREDSEEAETSKVNCIPVRNSQNIKKSYMRDLSYLTQKILFSLFLLLLLFVCVYEKGREKEAGREGEHGVCVGRCVHVP